MIYGEKFLTEGLASDIWNITTHLQKMMGKYRKEYKYNFSQGNYWFRDYAGDSEKVKSKAMPYFEKALDLSNEALKQYNSIVEFKYRDRYKEYGDEIKDNIESCTQRIKDCKNKNYWNEL